MGASSSTPTLGKSSTALDVVKHYNANLAGKTALVTGAAGGLGLETVKALTHAGCRVFATARDVAAGERAIQAELAGGEGAATPYAGNFSLVKVFPLNLEHLQSVRALATALEAEAPLDFVVCNAGIMALETCERTPAGFEKQIGVNHFAHHLLVSLLRPRIVARTDAAARIIYVSSLAHRRGGVEIGDLHFFLGRVYTPWVAYGQSKKCNMLEARELADQLATSGARHITVASLHPGIIATNLGRHMALLKNPLVGVIFRTFILDKTIGQGAATTLYACLSPDVINGSYLADCRAGDADEEGTDASGAKRKALWAATETQLAEALAKGAA